jgi:hypothetical protein
MFMPERNPFEVLRLDPSSSEEEIIRRATQLRRRESDETALAELRRAVQALAGRSEDRLLQSLLAHPRPAYDSAVIERLAAACRKRPPVAAQASTCPPLDLNEFAAYLARWLSEELDTPPLPFESVDKGDEPAEIQLQSEEALWQSLIVDARA